MGHGQWVPTFPENKKRQKMCRIAEKLLRKFHINVMPVVREFEYDADYVIRIPVGAMDYKKAMALVAKHDFIVVYIHPKIMPHDMKLEHVFWEISVR